LKRSAFIRLFVTFFSAFTLLNLYIFISGWNSLPDKFQLPYLIFFLFMFLSFPLFLLDRLLFKSFPAPVNSFLHWVGSIWIALFTYFLIAVVLIDLVRVINLVIPFLPQSFYADYTKTKFITFIVVLGVVLATFLYGFFNARSPRVKKLSFDISKKAGSLKSLKIAAASDIHLGVIVSDSRVRRIVKMLNDVNADIILLPGDVIDEDLAPVIKQNLGEQLRGLKAKYGVYAVTGNHEYIGGVEPACEYLTEHGITMLRDKYVKIADSFYVIGREDRAIRGFAGKTRKALADIMEGIDRSLPLILLDHQPAHLEEAEQQGIDLQLSGHTHHGQFFPVNLITKKMYEVSWGYKKKGNTHYYVSCGAGSWGPPIRIGNTPEILEIELKFNG
jgi:predicted MPP superfamily phosphohydrolase